MKLTGLIFFAVAFFCSSSAAQIYGEPGPDHVLMVAGGTGPNHDQLFFFLLVHNVGGCEPCPSMMVFMAPCGSPELGMFLTTLPMTWSSDGYGVGTASYPVPPAAMNRLCGTSMKFTFVCPNVPSCSYSYCTVIQC